MKLLHRHEATGALPDLPRAIEVCRNETDESDGADGPETELLELFTASGERRP